jgi:hypothetical protein
VQDREKDTEVRELKAISVSTKQAAKSADSDSLEGGRKNLKSGT